LDSLAITFLFTSFSCALEILSILRHFRALLPPFPPCKPIEKNYQALIFIIGFFEKVQIRIHK
jgi:hypothetical protein